MVHARSPGSRQRFTALPATCTLTERQREVLLQIARLTRQHGYPPTIRELGRVLSISSTNGVIDHLRALERKGVIEPRNGPGSGRTLVLTPAGLAELGDEAEALTGSRIDPILREEIARFRSTLFRIAAHIDRAQTWSQLRSQARCVRDLVGRALGEPAFETDLVSPLMNPDWPQGERPAPARVQPQVGGDGSGTGTPMVEQAKRKGERR